MAAGRGQRRRLRQVGLLVVAQRVGAAGLGQQRVPLRGAGAVAFGQQAVDVQPPAADVEHAGHDGELEGLGRGLRDRAAAQHVAGQRAHAPVQHGHQLVGVGVQQHAALLEFDASPVQQRVVADA
jgi:hypothetical protein